MAVRCVTACLFPLGEVQFTPGESAFKGLLKIIIAPWLWVSAAGWHSWWKLAAFFCPCCRYCFEFLGCSPNDYGECPSFVAVEVSLDYPYHYWLLLEVLEVVARKWRREKAS